MHRHYFISDDLDDLERIENELEAGGIDSVHIHVLSECESEVGRHHLHKLSLLLKKDVVNSGCKGAVVGTLLAGLLLAFAYIGGWADGNVGWTPFILLAASLVGFCAWDGGFLGMQQCNRCFRRFEACLRDGHHVFFVDVDDKQQAILDQVVARHPLLQGAGTGTATRLWLPGWRDN